MASYRYPNLEFVIRQNPTDQPMPTYRYTRTNFIGAGVDNFAQPPAQDPEQMMQLTNVMPITDGVCKRRWGYSLWKDPGNINEQYLYDYQSDITLNRNVLINAPGIVRAQNDDGSDYNPNLFTPTGGVAPRAVDSRSFMYFSNGLAGDYLKWDGSASGGVTNWGIDINDVTGTKAGPLDPSTATDTGAGPPSGSEGPFVSSTWAASGWSNDSNVTVLDGQDATYPLVLEPPDPMTGNQTYTNTTPFVAQGFGFAIPSGATITGIAASIKADGSAPYISIGDGGIFLVKGGVTGGTDHSASPWNGMTANYGGSNDLWGLTLTPADINASTFGISVEATGTWYTDANYFITQTVGIDYITLTVYYTNPVGPSWTNPNNIKADDGAVATASVTNIQTSGIEGSAYGFAVSGGNSIAGILVTVKCDATPITPTLQVTLIKAGVLYGETKTYRVNNTSLMYLTFGGANDLWNGTWLPADINASGFGVDVKAISPSGSTTLNIDVITVTVYSEAGPISLGSKGSGAITLVTGRKYFAVFENSLTGHYSDLNPVSVSTGPMTSQDQSLSNIPVSLDPQVDTVVLLATADGGDETRLFLLTSLPNGTTTYTDNTDELTLLNQPTLLSTDATGSEFGVSNNDLPPVGAIYPIKHIGRLYMVSGPTLYWSKSITEVTTDTTFIAGRWEESWPPANQVDISEGAESARGLLSDGVNLYIGTEFKILRQTGDAPFLEPATIVHNEVGIMNQDVWQICFIEGTPVGAMWLSPDNRIVGSDFNTYQDVGTAIQTTLNSINTVVAVKTARASFFSSGAYDLYILAIPTDANSFNDTLCVYNLRSQQWFIWKLTDNMAALMFQILLTGAPQFLMASTTGKIYKLDPTVTQDQIGVSPTSFAVTLQTSWLDLSDPAMRKALNEVEVQTDDATLSVTVEGASKHPDYAAPHMVALDRQVKVSPRGEYKVYLASAKTVDRYYRFTFISDNNAAINVLCGLNVEAVPINRQ